MFGYFRGLWSVLRNSARFWRFCTFRTSGIVYKILLAFVWNSDLLKQVLAAFLEFWERLE